MSKGSAYLTSADLEREIAATRARLSRGLALLDREYALRNLFIHAVRLIGNRNGAPVVAVTLKRNAVPLGLIGLGIAWLTFAGRESGVTASLLQALESMWRLAEKVVGRDRSPPTA